MRLSIITQLAYHRDNSEESSPLGLPIGTKIVLSRAALQSLRYGSARRGIWKFSTPCKDGGGSGCETVVATTESQ